MQTIIDLTRLLNDKIPVYPDTVPPKFETSNTVEKDGFKETLITMVSHTGTHIDAPCHILQDGRSLDQFPPDKFMGSALVIRCRGLREIGLDFLKTHEQAIAKADFILFFTGWQDKWNTPDYFTDCPIPTKEAANWLSRFPLKGLGIDAFSLDRIDSASTVCEESLPNHHVFLRKEILLIENLCNLDQLPDSGFTFQCFPLKIEQTDGSPVRAVGMIG
jgi:arylformamidase